MSSDLPSPALRPLGAYERFRVVLHDLGFHHNVSVAASYVRKSIKQEDIRLLVLHAFRVAVETHPALGLTVEQSSTNDMYFQRLSTIDLQKVVRFQETLAGDASNTITTESLLTEENNRGFDDPLLPLWRAIVLIEENTDKECSFHIAFVWHHVIGDGRSGWAVHSTLLKALNDAQANDNLQAMDTEVSPSTATPTPSLEELLKFRHAGKSTSEFLSKTSKWTGGAYDCSRGIHTKLHHLAIPPDILQQLIQRCREMKTTVTPLLQAALAQIVLAETGANGIRAASAISLTRFFDSSVCDSQMGLWINAFVTDYDRTQFQPADYSIEVLWRRAVETSARFESEITTGASDAILADFGDIEDFRTFLLNKMGTARPNTFGLTNLGAYSAPGASAEDNARITDMVLSQSCHVNGAAIQICVASVAGGPLNIMFSWQEGIVDEDLIKKIATRLDALLREI